MKSKAKYFRSVLCLSLMILSHWSIGQVTIPQQAPEQCSTMERDSISRLLHPERGSLEDFEYALNRRVEAIRLERKNGRTQAIVTVPVVFHIVHNGEAIGSGANLSLAQVQSQIAVLNEDFRRQAGSRGFNTSPVGADIEVEFCLSPVDDNGTSLTEPGIDRFNGNQADWSQDQIENTLKPTSIWNPNLFYNVWTVKFAATEGGLLGYAQFPDQTGLQGIPANSPASTDGVVIAYKTCGSSDKGTFPVLQSPYDKGRTLTHETGHWFGLRHIWGDGLCGDDFVADTPTQKAASNGCPEQTRSCDNSTLAMVQNYMDYSYDACHNIYTKGQKDRMQAAIELSPRRKSLVQGNLCSPTVADVPTANFIASNQSCVLLGSEIEFTDLSSNFPNKWSWEFEGGDPNLSTDRNPKVTYNTPGTFKVTLTSTNSLGASDPFTIEGYIVVSEQGLCNTLSNYQETYTPSLIKLAAFGDYTGYLTGNNSAGSMAFAEFYENICGYKYISGASIRFGNVKVANEDAKINVVVWSARGALGGPNPVIERKEVLLKQIQDDVMHDRSTVVTFDRLTPIFSRPFHIGFEITNSAGDTVVVRSSADGEATNATSWVKNASGQWQLFTIAYGASIAMDIKPLVGANPSVQVAASKQLIYPGEQVILNGQGASIFVWNADDGTIQDYAGPQIVVNPTKQTTYTIAGSGLDLCNTTASTTIYIRQEGITGAEEPEIEKGILVYPNPGAGLPNLIVDNDYMGEVEVEMHNSLGLSVTPVARYVKESRMLTVTLPGESSAIRSGVYLVSVKLGKDCVVKKWIKL
ncbi:MAG: M43 family zinc metalloprotease [Chryseolinea sp.]